MTDETEPSRQQKPNDTVHTQKKNHVTNQTTTTKRTGGTVCAGTVERILTRGTRGPPRGQQARHKQQEQHACLIGEWGCRLGFVC